MSSAEFGDIALLEPGMVIWSRTVRRMPDDLPAGGILLEVTDNVDADTGELRSRYRTVDPYCTVPKALRAPAIDVHRAFHTMPADDIDRTGIEIPGRAYIVRAIRRYAATLAAAKHTTWLPEDARHLADMIALARAVTAQ